MNTSKQRRIFQKLKTLNFIRSAIGIATGILVVFFGFQNVVTIFLFNNNAFVIPVLSINFLLRIINHSMVNLKIEIDQDLKITSLTIIYGILIFEVIILSFFQIILLNYGVSIVIAILAAGIYLLGSRFIAFLISKRIQKSTL